jgi:hypothetical protein
MLGCSRESLMAEFAISDDNVIIKVLFKQKIELIYMICRDFI